VRTQTYAMLLALAFVLVAGCTQGAAPGPRTGAVVATSPPMASIVPTEALPGGGARATTATTDLLLSVEVSATQLAAGRSIRARVVLTNTSPAPIRWGDFRLGWGATVTGSKSIVAMSVGLGFGAAGMGATPRTLAAGETTSRVMPFDNASPGVYHVTASVNDLADRRSPSATTPEILVTVR
jgi:hypothetical protein